jgi:hypothetical protein
MKWMQETTVWEEEFQPNHIYLLDGEKALAYIRLPSNEPKVFSKPLKLDLRRRTFKEIAGPAIVKPTVPEGRAVQGSKGETYYVNDVEGTCTCSGFKFRGSCKHISG